MTHVHPASGDVDVQVRTELDEACHGHDDAMEELGAFTRLRYVPLLEECQEFGDVEFLIDVDLCIRTFVHEVGHDGMEPIDIAYPTRIPAVPPASPIIIHGSRRIE